MRTTTISRLLALTAVGVAASAPAAQPADSSGPARAKNGGEDVEEIVVTAQRRRERLQDVPVSISVLSGADLDSSNQSVINKLDRIPGFAAVDSDLGGKVLSVRGVASTAAMFAGTSTVGYYLDSVPFGFIRQALSPDANAYDLERVEVLRGPQGTLYGVSAANGVVRVLTKDADLDEFQLKFRTTGASTTDGGENYRGDVAANFPLVPGKVAARAVVGYDHGSGWVDSPNAKDINDSDNLNLRLKINAQLTDALSAALLGWRSETDFDGRSLAREDMTTGIVIPEPSSEHYDVLGLKVVYEFASASLSSATSYIDYEQHSTVTIGGASTIPLVNQFDSTIFSEEINLVSSHEGPWKWALGGIYRDAKDLTAQNVPGLFPNPKGSMYNDYSESFAVFGELTRRLLDGQWELTGGLRYFEDRGRNKQTANPFDVNATLINDEGDFDAVSPRVVLTWHPSDQLTAYASYSEGFRSGFSQGSFVLSAVPGFPPVDSDNLTNYELGVKGSTSSGAVSYEVATFFMDWEGIQQQIIVPVPSLPNGVSALVNGKSASGLGAEFALTLRPTPGLDLSLNYSWNDLTFDEDVTTTAANLVLAPKGARLTNSPEHTAGASLGYSFPWGSSYEAHMFGGVNYISPRLARALVAGVGGQEESGEDILTSRVGFSVTSQSNWTATLFADNLNNDTGGNIVTLLALRPIQGDSRIRPRTIGLQFEYRL